MPKRFSLLLCAAILLGACNSRASQSPREALGDSPAANSGFINSGATSGILNNESQTITLLFAGDLMQHESQIQAARTDEGTYDYDGCFRYIKPQIEAADVAIANLEVTLAGAPYSGYPRFCAPDDYLHAIKDAGFDILLTANNHSCDTGKKGIERTIRMLDSLGIPHLGTYLNSQQRAENYPFILERKGFRIALLNYTYGTNGIPVPAPNIVNLIDTVQILKDILMTQQQNPDAIIACMHWGTEYVLQPDANQRKMARWLFQKGVTHIIGNHPHVVEPIEVIKDSLGFRHVLVWSTGNFISGMKAPNTDGGLIVRLTLEKQPQAAVAYLGQSKAQSATTLKNADYSLVWVSRPAIGNRKEYRLYPANISKDLLNENERTKMNAFLSAARNLLSQYNKDIKENINP